MEKEYELSQIETEIQTIIAHLHKEAKLRQGAVVVFGASTSEVAGYVIGKNSVVNLGEHIAKVIIATCKNYAIQPVFQCCEHLNRALVMEEECLQALHLRQVNAVPQPKAGGSVPTGAYQHLQHPVLAEAIQADAAVDIGNTLVGMHIRPVAVPLRLQGAKVGCAPVVMAYARLPYIGGSRAHYLD